MANLVQDCPHCGARNTTFDVHGSRHHDRNTLLFNVFASCPVCDGPVAAIIECSTSTSDPAKTSDNLNKSSRFKIRSTFPVRSAAKAPEHVPDGVARAVVEGGENLADGRYTSAVAMFRRAIDIATRAFSTEVTAWKLEKRIDKFSDEGLLTKDMRIWAHKIRLEGNEAIHEDAEPTAEQATELQLFTQLLLVYMYTLPAKVQASIAGKAE
jgi:hypothetical protein